MSLRTLVILSIVVSGACRKDSRYCAGAYLDNCNFVDSAITPDHGPTGCTSDPDCKAPTGVCNLATAMCVQCTTAESSACTGTSPVCGTDSACRVCKTHDECPSKACLPDGSCGTDANVAYVDPTGTDNASCTKATPCTKAAKALATTRPFVKFHGTIDEQVTINNQNVTLLADTGSKLTYTSGAGVLLKVDGTSSVDVYDLAIADALGATGIGISMPPGNTATLTLTRATVSNNAGGGISITGGSLKIFRSKIGGNSGGGISISNATFSILNNMFFSNGSGSSTVGAIAISTTQNSANRLDFNSFSKNSSQDGIGSAIQCIAGTFTARNNAMAGNGTLSNTNQTGGACSHAYSISTPGAVPAGPGNVAVDPKFVNSAIGDLHLQPGSPAVDAGDPASDLTGVAAVDFDGDSRPIGARADIGADEL